MTIAVCPDTGPRAWLVTVSPDPAVTEVLARDDERCGSADVRLDGAPAALYLTLWNRSDEITAEGDTLDLWRRQAQIVW